MDPDDGEPANLTASGAPDLLPEDDGEDWNVDELLSSNGTESDDERPINDDVTSLGCVYSSNGREVERPRAVWAPERCKLRDAACFGLNLPDSPPNKPFNVSSSEFERLWPLIVGELAFLELALTIRCRGELALDEVGLAGLEFVGDVGLDPAGEYACHVPPLAVEEPANALAPAPTFAFDNDPLAPRGICPDIDKVTALCICWLAYFPFAATPSMLSFLEPVELPLDFTGEPCLAVDI